MGVPCDDCLWFLPQDRCSHDLCPGSERQCAEYEPLVPDEIRDLVAKAQAEVDAAMGEARKN
jgi:hypothetical protein